MVPEMREKKLLLLSLLDCKHKTESNICVKKQNFDKQISTTCFKFDFDLDAMAQSFHSGPAARQGEGTHAVGQGPQRRKQGDQAMVSVVFLLWVNFRPTPAAPISLRFIAIESDKMTPADCQ